MQIDKKRGPIANPETWQHLVKELGKQKTAHESVLPELGTRRERMAWCYGIQERILLLQGEGTPLFASKFFDFVVCVSNVEVSGDLDKIGLGGVVSTETR